MPLTREEQRHGMRNAILSQAFGSQFLCFIYASAVFPLFLKKLGASDLQAMLPGMAFYCFYLVQVPISLIVPPERGKAFLMRCWFSSSVTMLLALAPLLWLGEGVKSVYLLLIGVIAAILLQVAGTAFWFPLLYDVVPANRRGRFFGTMRSIWSLVFLGLSMAAGVFLGAEPPLWKYIAVMGCSTALQLVREPFVARIPVLPAATDSRLDWRSELRYVVSRRETRIFCGYYLLLLFLAGFLGAPLVLYMHHLGFSTRDNTLIYAMSVLGRVVALYGAGPLVDRVGTKRVFIGVHVLLCALAFGVTAIGELPAAYAASLMIGLQILSGATLAVSNLASTTQIFHMAPARGKALHLILTNGVVMLGSGLSPFLAGLLFDSRWRTAEWSLGGIALDIYQLLFMAAGAGLLAALALVRFVADVRAMDKARPAKDEAL